MEKKSHILFTYTWIYGLAFLSKYFWNTPITNWYHILVYSFPLITIPYMAIVTMLPDSDTKNGRINRTILGPIWVIIRFFANHRWFTHRLSWILFFWIILSWLYLLWTNIITIIVISFLAITCIWILIDDFRINVLGIKINKIAWVRIDNKLIDKFFTILIVLFFPLLLIPEMYQYFLIGLFFAYVFHMFWDAFSKEWWTIVKFPEFLWWGDIKFQLPSFLAFRVWWKIERKIIRPILWILLILIIYLDREFIFMKFQDELLLSIQETQQILNNPEILLSDLDKIKERASEFRDIINYILGKILW